MLTQKKYITKVRPRGWNFELKTKDIEPGGGVSCTIPDDSWTINQLMERHRKGLLEEVQKTPVWSDGVTHDSPDLEKVPLMDIYEQTQFKQSVIDDVARLKRTVEDNKEKLAKKHRAKLDEKKPAPPEEKSEGKKPAAPLFDPPTDDSAL